jgi:hypothetical protein
VNRPYAGRPYANGPYRYRQREDLSILRRLYPSRLGRAQERNQARMDEGDKAHVERAEGLQQALFAYHETWEWFLQLPVS